jgi:hypothetical protein
VEARRFIRSGIAASALGHLSVLTLVLFFAEVHPFGSVTAEPITVDLVSPEAAEPPNEAVQAPEPKAQPSDSLDLSSKPAPSSSPAPDAAPPAPTQPQKQAALPTPSPIKQEAGAEPQQPPATSSSPGFIPPEPDLSIKYHVMLGLPPELPQIVPQDKSGDGFDAPASEAPDLASTLVTEFRRHLRTCSKLPQPISPSDPIKIKLRVFMAPDGNLAADPVLIEASASAKGPALMQSAITALQSCQPYAMLPAERYGEWKVLDLGFTPKDF